MSASPIVLVGNATQDPDLKYLENGTPKLTFGIAVNHYWNDQSGAKQEKTSFFNVVAWRGLAEDSARILEKGIRIVVSGRLEQRTWEGDDGKKNSVIELVADDIGASVRGLESVVRISRPGRPENAAPNPRHLAKVGAPAKDEEPF